MLKIYTNSVFYRHDTGFDHPERPSRIDAAVEGVGRAGLCDGIIRDVDVHPDTGRIIHKVHSAGYERELEDAVRAGYRFFHSIDNPISPASYSAARAAVATSISAAPVPG
jgi:acetoin utilization deacetylase AcuC-like enzyme